jgi:hypothetical protein
VTLFYYGLWMLCGIGAAVLGADAARPPRRLLSLAAGFVTGALLFRQGRLPDLTWIAGVTALAAAFRVVRPGPLAAIVAPAAAGFLAATWAALFQAQGVPAVASLPVAAAVPALSALLGARSRTFAPDDMQDEALLLLTALAALLACAPGLLAGWQSAGALNLEGKRSADVVAQALPRWTIVMTIAAASLGGAYSVWTRR